MEPDYVKKIDYDEDDYEPEPSVEYVPKRQFPPEYEEAEEEYIPKKRFPLEYDEENS